MLVLVDDGDPGFVQGGAQRAWLTGQGGVGGDLTWTTPMGSKSMPASQLVKLLTEQIA